MDGFTGSSDRGLNNQNRVLRPIMLLIIRNTQTSIGNYLGRYIRSQIPIGKPE